MDTTEFDRFADEYYQQHRANIAITGEDPAFFADYKVRVTTVLAQAQGLAPSRVLDFGSGIGNAVPHFRQHMPQASLTGADVSQRSLDLAAARFPGLSEPLLITGNRIPAEDARFDLAFSACVFHHIPHEQHVAWLRELRRVTRPGGMLAIFEHNPWNPLTRRAVDTCPFDENAQLLAAGQLAKRFRSAGWHAPRIRFHIFFPRFLSALRPLERRLSRVPLGAQYSVVAR